MADHDQSINNLRYNQVTQGLEGFGGGSPMWTPLTLTADGGLNQLTGDVTAGPGGGSQVATIANSAITNVKVSASAAIAFSKLAALPSTNILVGNVSNVPTAVALSGDATLSNTGALTLATVNSNVGSFTSANITVDAKGRITAAANGSGGASLPAVVATINLTGQTAQIADTLLYATPNDSTVHMYRITAVTTITAAGNNIAITPYITFTNENGHTFTDLVTLQGAFSGTGSNYGANTTTNAVQTEADLLNLSSFGWGHVVIAVQPNTTIFYSTVGGVISSGNFSTRWTVEQLI